MTSVDFYNLKDSQIKARLLFVCRLVERGLGSGLNIYIHTNGADETAYLDELLWSFKAESFLAHEVMPADPEADISAPIQLGHYDHAGKHHDSLINLASPVPDFFSRFLKVKEIVTQDAETLRKTRLNYKFYQDRGYPLQLHQVAQR